MKYVFILLLILSCSSYEDSYERRSANKAENLPSITASLLDCNDPYCKIKIIEDSGYNTFNNIINLNSEALNNINNSAKIKIQIKNIEIYNISEVKYFYEKKDFYKNTIYKTDEKKLVLNEPENLTYIIPINIESLGTGIVNTLPYENHYINIIIIDREKRIYKETISLNMASLIAEPIVLKRSENILKQDYYSFNMDKLKYIIDSVEVENILDSSIFLEGKINLLNITKTIISKIYNINKVELYKPKDHCNKKDFYKWSKDIKTEYEELVANPYYGLELVVDDNTFEIPVTSFNNDFFELNFKNIKIEPKQKIILNLISYFQENRDLLGEKGEKTIYEGLSYYTSIPEPSKCKHHHTYTYNSNCEPDNNWCMNICEQMYNFSFYPENLYPDCPIPGLYAWAYDISLTKSILYKYFASINSRYHYLFNIYQLDVLINNEIIHSSSKIMDELETQTEGYDLVEISNTLEGFISNNN